ncbi:carcinoembryonic antigen-related cell adhesion molecule 19 [Onychomys torridus]|uniref:carcinoembryonic antigen-related cell adhesion molecule 19 n=1 Tax=Onychomys torridus TaxID=38674 RepID=UPI00167F785D|nr:carcinoembryonic antigen-related cell adhesion molecule 19 [Onychomys torridus]
MEIPTQTQGCFSKGLLFSALILALWLPKGSQAALHIQKIPEQPQKNQDLLLSLHGVPSTVQDFIWYLGEETNGGTRLFSYIPGLLRPQRDGSAMGQRDIIGFPNGSMLLRGAQPSDSGTYQVAVTINPAWTMKAKTEVQVAAALHDKGNGGGGTLHLLQWDECLHLEPPQHTPGLQKYCSVSSTPGVNFQKHSEPLHSAGDTVGTQRREEKDEALNSVMRALWGHRGGPAGRGSQLGRIV